MTEHELPSTGVSWRRRAVGRAALVAQLVGLCAAVLWGTRRDHSALEALFDEVPAAEQVLAFEGRGFLPARQGRFQSAAAPVEDTEAPPSIEVHAPLLASGAFAVGAEGLKRSVNIELLGASPVQGTVDNGALSYPGAFDGADVVAVRDPDHLELAFVVRDPARTGELKFRLDPPKGARVEHEPSSGAVIVRSETGRPILRVEPPAAFDAHGAQRSGDYQITDSVVSIRLPLAGLEPPVLIDPMFAIPFWTILADNRAPGAVVYDAQRDSTETKTVYDPIRGAVLLTRPVRPQQLEDSRIQLGRLVDWQFWDYVSPYPRISGRNGPTSGEAERRDWWTSFWAESETFHWTAGKWTRSISSGLPGQIDNALAVDPGTQHVISLGGLQPEFFCAHSPLDTWGDNADCKLFQPATTTYDFDGSKWTPKSLAGPPSLRVRGTTSQFKDKVLLFGGRAAAVAWLPSPQYGAPFPDNLTEQVLNDTWVYNGKAWQRIGTANPPPPRESGQLVFDDRRQRAVLIGGINAVGVDAFDIWEFDGSDWIARFTAGSSSLPESLRNRTGMLAAWNPVRKTTLLFGGVVNKLESCTLSETDIRAQSTSLARKQELVALGCFGGYLHDFWEWDGQQLRRLNSVGYGGMVGDLPVFRQLSGGSITGAWGPLPAASAAPPATSGSSALWPWRYDARPEHFKLRTELERAHLHDSAYSAGVPTSEPTTTATPAASASTPTFVSPLFGGRARPQMVFDVARGKAVIITPHDASVFETDGANWADTTPRSTPFDQGSNDFFAAAWDSTAHEAILFDPRTAATWRFSDQGGWQRLTLATSPPIWSIDPTLRREHDLDLDRNPGSIASKLASVSAAMPQMTFDRARGKAVMLYASNVWELGATGWAARAPWNENCPAATLLTYDGARRRTVAVGCQVPAQTFEWDGTDWFGTYPAPSLYPANALRVTGNDSPRFWTGTLQTSWAHPNALAETPLLGGVSLIDTDGKVRTWDGTTWKVGPGRQYGHGIECAMRSSTDLDDIGIPLNGQLNVLSGNSLNLFEDFLPTCAFPPLVEDFSRNRLLMFLDGLAASEELRFEDPTPIWQRVKVAKMDWYSSRYEYQNYYFTYLVHPHPYELYSPEHVYLKTLSDPSNRLLDYPYHRLSRSPQEDALTPEGLLNNLYWPYRILMDRTDGRVRVLTHRGMMWELGAEMREGLSEPCIDDSDCVEGYCTKSDHSPTRGICCNHRCGQTCATCEGEAPGTTAGICQVLPRGSLGTPGHRCSDGSECAPRCSGEWGGGFETVFSSCELIDAGKSCGGATSCQDGVLNSAGKCSRFTASCQVNTPAGPCAGGLTCQDATSCKTTCNSPADCTQPNQICSADKKSCIPDGKVCHNHGECPRFHECAADGKTCTPDRALAAATDLGVLPSTWEAPSLRTPEEIAAILKSLGYEQDGEGRIHLNGLGDIDVAFDPARADPLTGLRACLIRIQACIVNEAKWDECVAAAPRCESSTPWLGDTGGNDCCPEECLVKYFDARRTGNPREAIEALMSSACYPGLREFVEGGAP